MDRKFIKKIIWAKFCYNYISDFFLGKKKGGKEKEKEFVLHTGQCGFIVHLAKIIYSFCDLALLDTWHMKTQG